MPIVVIKVLKLGHTEANLNTLSSLKILNTELALVPPSSSFYFSKAFSIYI